MNKIAEELQTVTKPANIRTDELMSAHTSFKTGGCADVFVTPGNIEEAADIVRLLLARGIPYTVIGNGSNILVSDKGYRGVIVCMSRGTDNITVTGDTVTAGAGALLSRTAAAAYDSSLTGLEFASGIPGSVGGAVVMNAGAYGSEVKDVIDSVRLLDTKTGETIRLSGDEMEFGYRTSIVKSYPYVVLEAVFALHRGDRKLIKEKTDELAQKRRSKQPLEYPSAGSTFKRPEGFFAGKLIEDAGLKGYSIGGAMVSDKHCGFVINKGGATSAQILELIRHIRQKVYETSSVMLEPEVVLLGEDIVL